MPESYLGGSYGTSINFTKQKVEKSCKVVYFFKFPLKYKLKQTLWNILQAQISSNNI